MHAAPTILIADDDADVRELVAFRLGRAGYRTITAADGREALGRALNESPDLCVFDIAMPGADGLEVTRALRANPATRTMPVVLLTALSQERDVRAGIGAGADAYVRKPFSHRELCARVASLVAAPVAGVAAS